MKPSSLIAAAVLAVACGQSQAATYHLGVLSGSTLIADSFAARSGHFTDFYNFSVAAPSSFAGVAVALNFDLPFLAGAEFNISNFSISLTDGSTGAVYTDRNGSDGFSLSALLGPGATHSFSIDGFVNGSWGGSYAAAVNVSPVVSPIPEPSTYALMLAGLGVVGFMASRRRARQD